MKVFCKLALVAGVAVVLSGCSSLKTLNEPYPIPRTTGTYESSDLGDYTRAVAVGLDLQDCVEAAMLVNKGMFGGASIDATFPVRAVVQRELEKMISENFHLVKPGESADLYIKVTTRRILLTDCLLKMTSDVSLNIKVLHPDETRRPLFRKDYRSRTYGPMDDEDEVPACFYNSVQQIVDEFVTDLSSDRKLVSYFEAKGKNKE